MAFLLAVLAGAVAGSFIAVIVSRLPLGETIVRGRSRCDACRATLGPTELIPLVSFAALGGRCRHCRAAIGAGPVLAEIAGAFVAVLAWHSADTPGAITALALFAWTLLTLALLDQRHLWLPDRITLPLIAAGLAVTPLFPSIGLESRLAGALLGWLGLEALRLGYRRLRRREGLGGGDAKLLAGIGAWLGAPALPTVLLMATGLGLAIAAIARLRGDRLEGDAALPLGTFLAVAALAWMPVALHYPEATIFRIA